MSSKASCKQAPKYLIPKSSFQQYYSRLLHPSEFGRAMDSKTVSSTIDMDRNQTSHRGFTNVGVRNFSVNQEIEPFLKAEQPALLKLRIRLRQLMTHIL